jgi:nucleotide-binding universal stress UspA family protein
MNVFPTRILLASDGSESAAHATEVAVELSKKTNSELHVLYVGEYSIGEYSTASLVPQAADPAWVVQENLASLEKKGQQFEQVARQTLDAEVREVGGTVTQAHLRLGTPAAEIVELAEELEVGLIVVGSRSLGGIRRAFFDRGRR